MANEIARLVATITADTKGLERGLKQSKTSLSSFSAALKQIGPMIGVTFGAASIAMIAKTGMELGKLGAESLRLKTSFAQLASGMGSSSDAILSSLKKASQGAIAETDLILAANRAMMLGLGANAQELGKLHEVAAYRHHVAQPGDHNSKGKTPLGAALTVEAPRRNSDRDRKQEEHVR